MKKRMRLIVICVVILGLAAAWTWRYVTLNKYYDDLDNSGYQLYQAGEWVPFEDDRNDFRTDLNGYYVRVDGYEIWDFDSYLDSKGITLERPQADPDKLLLVKITLKKESGEPNPVMLTDLSLRTEDTGLSIDWDVLTKANDMLGGRYTGVALNPGDQCEAVLPYGLWEKKFKARTWRSLNEMELYLKVTKGLTAKEVQVNG